MATTANKTVYERHRLQHIVRFIALAGIVALDIGLITSTINQHLSPRIFTLAAIGQEAVSYCLILVCNLIVLPSILLEANRVEITEDRLIIDNLISRTSLPWAEITSVATPVYLKFAIIKTRRFFYLINKRDMDRFPDLINTITDKMGRLAN